jgi:uncharacterized protein (DUF305 family)
LSTKALTIGIAAVLVVGIAIIAVIMGGDHGGHGDSANARETDGAFIVEMTPHHESAIEMAKVALKRAEHPEIKTLARAIISSQAEEIAELATIHSQLFGVPVSQGSHGTLGLQEHQMGMSGEMAMLDTAKPFDRAFIEMMAPHHQGAIRMARVELQSGEDNELMGIAQAIVEAQTREIEEMNAWRKDWYGSSSPTGGVPAEEEGATPNHMTMDHG